MLTDYEERCLIALVDLAREDVAPGRRWHALDLVIVEGFVGAPLAPTANRLARLGLIEFRPVLFSRAVRATDAGIAFCELNWRLMPGSLEEESC